MAIFQARTWLSRSFTTLSSNPLRVCVVGSGPAGFYTAEKMLKAHQEAQVDIIDRLPTPFGLVRSGVAPDHPETKGNVALDVARILLRARTELATTDISRHALAALEESSIRKVYLVGRRGPAQAACTAKELREILGIHNLDIKIQETDLLLTPADEEELKSSRIQKRVYELLSKAATSKPAHACLNQRELHFVFFRKPDSFQESKDRIGHVSSVRFEKTVLQGVGPRKQAAVGTGQFEDTKCGLVLKSIGYRSIPVDGLPFDYQKGIVPNNEGRVLSDASGDSTLLEEGLYVCGWLKRGPTGIIATNLYCAEETVSSISEDLNKGVLVPSSILPKQGRDGLRQLLHDRNVRIVSFSDWEKIDTEEKRRGITVNKPREKLATWEELLKTASG